MNAIPMKNAPLLNDSQFVIAMVGSNITSIAAELVAAEFSITHIKAITRRGCATSLEILCDGDAWSRNISAASAFRAMEEINRFDRFIQSAVAGRHFACLLSHSSDILSQLLISHPLCDAFYYIEEGLTSITGGKIGIQRNRPVKKIVNRFKCQAFYGGRMNRHSELYLPEHPKYDGCFALTTYGFNGFPRRKQLSMNQLQPLEKTGADIVVLLDSHYIIGNCNLEEYIASLHDVTAELIHGEKRIAVKFHPNENDPDRKHQIIRALSEFNHPTTVSELPAGFVAERLDYHEETLIVVGASSLGLYLSQRGFKTVSFARHLAAHSARFSQVATSLPEVFLRLPVSL